MDQEVGHQLDQQRDQGPHQHVDDGTAVFHRARQRQHEPDHGTAQARAGSQVALADQLDLGIPGDPHMDGQEHPEQQQCDDEIDREGRQSGERFDGEHGDICLRRLPFGEAGLTT